MSRLSNRIALVALGIDVMDLQDLAIASIPCAIESVTEAWNDTTNVAVNSPRALEIVSWKGLIRGLIGANKVLRKYQG